MLKSLGRSICQDRTTLEVVLRERRRKFFAKGKKEMGDHLI